MMVVMCTMILRRVLLLLLLVAVAVAVGGQRPILLLLLWLPGATVTWLMVRVMMMIFDSLVRATTIELRSGDHPRRPGELRLSSQLVPVLLIQQFS